MNTQDLFSVRGMVALITGGGTGIGLMMAKALIRAGAERIYIVGRRVDVLQQAAATIGSPNIVPLYCDVSSKVSLESIVSVVEKDIGFLNLLICNAGVGGPQTKGVNENTTLDEWRDEQMSIDMDDYNSTFRMNATAAWFTAMAFLKLLDAGNKQGNLEQRSQVILTSSIAGFNKQAPGGWAYGQSKAATTHAMKQLAVVLPKWNIRANCICPGLYPSEMSAAIVDEARAGGAGPALEMPTSKIPLGRFGDQNDMAGAILHLASRAGAYLNGHVTLTDGGRLGTFPNTY